MKSSLTISILLAVVIFGTITTSHTGSYAVESSRTIDERGAEASEHARESKTPYAVRYRLDAGQSRFMIEANSAGVLWFLGHTHHIAARDFVGDVEVTPGTLVPASLQMTIKTESMAETGEHFTEKQKEIITGSMRKDVLETAKYPEAVFKSANVTMKKKTGDQFEARIEGQLTLHGVTRDVAIPARVTLDGDTLRASGKFEIDRDDFKIKTHSVKWGTIRVDDDMKILFDIVARKN